MNPWLGIGAFVVICIRVHLDEHYTPVKETKHGSL